jgi:hypothetical protein
MFIGLKLSRDYENILLVRTACNYLVRGSEGTVPSISKDLPYKKNRQSINQLCPFLVVARLALRSGAVSRSNCGIRACV